MAITEAFAGNQTVGTAEWSLTADAARPVDSLPDTPSLVDSASGTTGNLTTATKTPTSGYVQLLFIGQWDGTSASMAAPSTPDGSACGLTFTAVANGAALQGAGGQSYRTDVYTARTSSPSSGQVTCTLSTGHDSFNYVWIEIGSCEPTTPIGLSLNGNGSSATPTITLSGSLASFSITVSGMCVDVNGLTPGSGYNELADLADANSVHLQVQYKSPAALVADGNTGGSARDWSGVAIEIVGLTAGSPQAETGDGCYVVFLDLNAVAAGDVFEGRLYEKAGSSSTQRLVEKFYFAGVQGVPNWPSPPFVLMHGWDFSLVKISGTDRSIDWSIRKVA